MQDQKHQELDLDRMKRLLNEHVPSAVKHRTPNKDHLRLLDSNCLEPRSDGINIDKADLCRAMSFKGNMVGYTNRSSIKTIHQDIISNIGTINIKSAKAILVTYIVNPNVSMFYIGDFMEELNDICSKECEIVFGTQVDNSLDKDTVQYKVLLTRIENSDPNLSEFESNYKETLVKNAQLEKKYNDLLRDYDKLESLNERLQLSMLSLKKEE